MKKRILAALVASAAVLSLAGCNTDNNSNSGANNSNNSSSSNSSSSGDSTGDNSGASTPDDDNFVVDKNKPQLIDTGIKPSDSEGKVINIWAWNDEFKGFFEKAIPLSGLSTLPRTVFTSRSWTMLFLIRTKLPLMTRSTSSSQRLTIF